MSDPSPPPSPPVNQNVSLFLANVPVALNVVSTASNIVNVPVLPVVLGAASTLLTVIETTRTNKEDCAAIAKYADDLISAISDLQSEMNGANLDQGVRKQLENLKLTLRGIKKKLAKIVARHGLLRFWTSRLDSDKIQGLKNSIVDALQNFQLWISVAQYLLSAEVMVELRKLVGTPQTPQDPFVYSKLPATPAIFFGRREYVANAVSLILTKSPARLAILGPGGMGKTSVAVAILHDPEIKNHFGQSRCFVPCEAVLTAEMLHTALRQELHVQISGQDPKHTLVKCLESVGCLLLVLDNLETPWNSDSRHEVEVLLGQLHSVKTLTLLITMRGTVYPSGPEWTDPDLPLLPPLDAESSKSAYLKIYSRKGDSELNTLLKEIDYVPLAITLSAKVAQSQRWSPDRMLKEWKKHHTARLKTDSSGRLSNLDISISLSIKQLEQEPQVLQLLALVCTLPDGIFKNQWPTIVSLFQDRIDLAAPTLRMSALAYEDSTRELHVLSPIRFYVQNSPDMKLKLPETIHQQLRQLYFSFAAHGGNYSYNKREMESLLSEESGNIESIILSKFATLDTENMIKAALAFSNFLYWTYPSCELLLHALYYSKDAPALKGKLLLELGDMHIQLNEYNNAIHRLQAAKQEFEDIGERLGAARCVQGLGDIARTLNEYEQATSLLQIAKQEFESVGNRLGAAQCLRSLGNISRMLNDYGQATTQLEASKLAFESIKERLGAAQCLRSLGDISRMVNEYGQAITQLHAAKQEFESLGQKLGATQCLQSLAHIACMLDEYEQATSQLQTAKQEFESIGQRLGAAQCLQNLAYIAYKLHRHDEAVVQSQAAQQQFESIGSQHGVAGCQKLQGMVAHMCAQYDEATCKLQSAKLKYEKVGDKDQVAECHLRLGEVAFMIGEYDNATSFVQGAKHQFESICSKWGVAWCQKMIGDILSALNEHDKGITQLHAAKEQFESIGIKYGVAKCHQSLGKSEHICGRHKEAVGHLQTAKDLLEMIGIEPEADECKVILAAVAEGAGQS